LIVVLVFNVSLISCKMNAMFTRRTIAPTVGYVTSVRVENLLHFVYFGLKKPFHSACRTRCIRFSLLGLSSTFERSTIEAWEMNRTRTSVVHLCLQCQICSPRSMSTSYSTKIAFPCPSLPSRSLKGQCKWRSCTLKSCYSRWYNI
jgi:hypothetical protein